MNANTTLAGTVTFRDYLDARFREGFGFKINLEESNADIATLLAEQKKMILGMVESFGVVEIALPNIDPTELLSGVNQVTFRSNPPSFTDACWHQDGSHMHVPPEKYKIGLLWPHTKSRVSGSTEVVPIGAFAASAEAAMSNPQDEWNHWSSFQDSIHTLGRNTESLMKKNRRSDYAERSIEAVRNVINHDVIACQREQTDRLISSNLSQNKAPVHQVHWQSPTFTIFSNRNTIHRRNGPSPAFGENAADTILRTNFLDPDQREADFNIWKKLGQKIKALFT